MDFVKALCRNTRYNDSEADLLFCMIVSTQASVYGRSLFQITVFIKNQAKIRERMG
jgi:hypothetical protein